MTLGRLASEERRKGFDEVIDVMPELLKRFPNLKYLIVGDGPDRDRLARRVSSEGLVGRVIFAGRVSEHEKVAHYRLCDAYVMPSAGEGFGIVLLEAAACGIEIIGSAIDGSKEALLDGALGTLIDPQEPGQLIAAITRALDGGRRDTRLPCIANFSERMFRERVAEWVLLRSS
jgi:glycosyltransferase involved in cell wall biosynthesis